MNSAAPAICFNSSDDEDYVSFDEEELDKGIADLYDEDSASDYNDDDDADDNVNLNEIVLPDQHQPNQQDAAMLIDAHPHVYPTPAIQPQEEEEKAKETGLFSRFRNKKAKEKESIKRSAFSMAAPSDNNNNNRKKKSKSSQLSKRMNRLRENQQHFVDKKAREKKVVHRQKVNTNVISIDLGTLQTAANNIATGDAFECKLCKAILSKHDVLLKQYEEIKLDDEDDSVWLCKFCNHINIISIDEEEMPKEETVDYILAPPMRQNEESKQSGDKTESQIIFCIDISGSMCVSQQIDSKHSKFKLKGNRLDKDTDDLSQFIEANASHLNKQKSDTQYVSRLQCVQTAVDEQIENLSQSHPNYKIGLVTFNNEVTVIGDGMGINEVITGDKLNNMQKLQEIGSKCVVNNNIGAARDKLCAALWNLDENGQTALGPALVVSIAMASAAPGSQVILCTDGLANIGVGSGDYIYSQRDKNKNDMIEADEDDEEEEDPVLQWYATLGDYAMMKGVVVNIISITDGGCKLENLGKIVEITNGNLKRINPLNLAEKFSGIIENESIATNCQAKMLLHPGLKFHNTVEAARVNLDDIAEENDNTNSKMEVEEKDAQKDGDNAAAQLDKINEGRKIYKIACDVQECGNIFASSRIFFEYVINKKHKKEFAALKELPFQVQISYQKKDGSKMLRVISQTKEVTLDREKVRNNLDFNVLAKYGTHVTTELCAKGDYESSRAWTSANTTFLNKNAMNKRQLLTLANYAQENVALDHQMQRQIQTESVQEPAVYGFGSCNYDEMAPSYKSRSASKKKAKKKKMKKRKNARNDQFSSHMYNLKKRSHK